MHERQERRPCILTVVWALLLALGACVPQKGPVTMSEEPRQASTSFFLNLSGAAPKDFSCTIAEIAVRRGGQWSVLASDLVVTAVPGQRFLGRLARGAMEDLRLRLGPVRRRDTVLTPAFTEKILTIPTGNARDRIVFVELDFQPAFDRSGEFAPVVRVHGPDRLLDRDLLFAACPSLDTVYLVRTDTNRVVGAMDVAGGPVRIGVLAERNELLVLCRRNATIARIDLNTGRERDRYRIPLLNDVRDMLLAADHRTIYCIGDDNLLVALDPRTGSLVGRQRLGRNLRTIAALADGGWLAVASAGTNEVHVVDGRSLAVQAVISTAGPPVDLIAVDGDILVAEEHSKGIVRYQASGQLTERRSLRIAASSLTAGDSFLYVATKQEVVILGRDSLAVVARVPTGAAAGELLLDPEHRWLYTALPTTGHIAVIDTTSRRLHGRISLGTPVAGLALLDITGR